MRMTSQMVSQEEACSKLAKRSGIVVCDNEETVDGIISAAEKSIESIVASRGGMGMTGLHLFRGVIRNAVNKARRRKP